MMQGASNLKNKFYSCLEISLCVIFFMMAFIVIYIILFRDILLSFEMPNALFVILLIIFNFVLSAVMTFYGLPRFEFSEKGITKRLFGIKLKHFEWEQINFVKIHSNGSFGTWVFLSKSDISSFSLGRCRLRRDNIFFYSSSKKIEIVKTFAPEIIVNELDAKLNFDKKL